MQRSWRLWMFAWEINLSELNSVVILPLRVSCAPLKKWYYRKYNLVSVRYVLGWWCKFRDRVILFFSIYNTCNKYNPDHSLLPHFAFTVSMASIDCEVCFLCDHGKFLCSLSSLYPCTIFVICAIKWYHINMLHPCLLSCSASPVWFQLYHCVCS